MLRFAVLALVASGLLSATAHAQTAPATQKGFGHCTVTDTSRAQATIWASPVFGVEYSDSDAGGFQRSQALAGEFLAHVGKLGGVGDKSCVVLPTQEETMVFRDQQRAIWDKRVYFIKIGDWREVAWTPAPWNPAATLSATSVTRYFLCHATQLDIPDRSDISRTVASRVFSMPVPGDDALLAVHKQAEAYATQFQTVVQAHGLPVQGSCVPYDTVGEANHAQQQLVRLLKGFNMKYAEVAWTPSAVQVSASTPTLALATAAASTPAPQGELVVPQGGLGVRIAPVTAELAQTLGLPSTQGAWVAEVIPGSAAMKGGIKPMDVLLEIAGQPVTVPADTKIIIGRLRPGFEAPVRVWRERRMQDLVVAIPDHAPGSTHAVASTAAAAPAPVVASAKPTLYCAAYAQRSKPVLLVGTPVWEAASEDQTQTAQKTGLERIIAAIRQRSPNAWYEFADVQCFDNNATHPGETFCVSIAHKHFRGAQLAAQFCNASRERLDARWQEILKAEGNNVETLPWPQGH